MFQRKIVLKKTGLNDSAWVSWKDGKILSAPWTKQIAAWRIRLARKLRKKLSSLNFFSPALHQLQRVLP